MLRASCTDASKAKLKKDAFVCIYEGGGDLDFANRVQPQFTESDVLQMMGRSSRSLHAWARA